MSAGVVRVTITAGRGSPVAREPIGLRDDLTSSRSLTGSSLCVDNGSRGNPVAPPTAPSSSFESALGGIFGLVPPPPPSATRTHC